MGKFNLSYFLEKEKEKSQGKKTFGDIHATTKDSLQDFSVFRVVW